MATAAKPEAQLQIIMPPRHWRWLALCNDRGSLLCASVDLGPDGRLDTVISIHEAPSHKSKTSASDTDTAMEEELKNMRLNTFTVLAQLSERGFEMFNDRPLSQAAMRQTLRSGVGSDAGGVSFLSTETDDIPHALAAEGSSKLFNYLFGDYVAASPLKAAVDIVEKMVGLGTLPSWPWDGLLTAICEQTKQVLDSTVSPPRCACIRHADQARTGESGVRLPTLFLCCNISARTSAS